MVTAASREGNTTPPATMALTASITTSGTFVRLATVLLRMRFPSRQASRSRMVGGEERLGMTSTLKAKAMILAWQQSYLHNILITVYAKTKFSK